MEQSRPADERPKEQNVRGYKVKVKYRGLDESKRKAKRQVMAQIFCRRSGA
jgi:hypothetical protein